MTCKHRFDDSTAQIEQEKKGYSANCECGWSSPLFSTREEAIISFENHVRSNPQHKLVKDEGGANHSSLFLAILGILYVISPIDLVPDHLVGIGWIGDILIGIISIILLMRGLSGESPSEILSNTFS